MIENGGKASMCEKMEVGDELVNINGTPLYGSRQEALILIKGSYKILRMIVRRRNASAIRPHSWHLAKLSEVHPDVASMQYPTDAFSLSWHSGCENSELPMQWNPLSRHCSTDKSSSIGSMESLDQPGQNYYEGTPSPIDPSMYQNKRDSAYSSFSASSNASDYTLSARAEESSHIDCVADAKPSDGRYLHTGQGAIEIQEEASSPSPAEHQQRPSSFPFDSNHLRFIKSPPQPPIRRDSLRASKNQMCHGEGRRASAPGDSLQISGMWSSEDQQHKNSDTSQCKCGIELCTVHLKNGLSLDQYYMLSSQNDGGNQSTDQLALGDKAMPSICSEMQSKWQRDGRNVKQTINKETENVSYQSVQAAKDSLLKHPSCLHIKSVSLPSSDREEPSVQTKFLKKEWRKTQSKENTLCQTNKCNGISSQEHKCNINRVSEIYQVESITDTGDFSHLSGKNKEQSQHNTALERSVSEPNEVRETFPVLLPKHSVGGMRSSCSSEKLLEESHEQEESQGPTKKPGSSRHRSAQMRRKSDRFATNLRNEIQRRKAQLQKSKESSVLLCGDEPVEEREEPTESQSPPRTMPPPPPPKNKLRLLELRRANAEQFHKGTDPQHLELNKQILPLKRETDKDNQKIETDENSLNAVENVTRTNDRSLISKSILQNESNKPFIYDPRQNQRIPAVLNNESMAPSAENCKEEWRTREPEFQRQNSKCLEQREPELGSVSECPDTCIKRNEVSRVSPNSDVKVSHEIWRTGSSLSINSVGSQTENFRSVSVESHSHYSGHKSLDADASCNGLLSSKEQFYSDGSSNDEWRVSCLDNDESMQRSREIMFSEPGRSSDHPSLFATQWRSRHSSSDFEDTVVQQMPNGGRWKWSPEHKLLPHPHLAKGSPPDVSVMHVESSNLPNWAATEENVLMPFADRRRFFENSSKVPNVSHIPLQVKTNKNNYCPSFSDPPLSQKVVSAVRRHSVDHTFHPSSPSRPDSALPYSEYRPNHAMDPLLCCSQGGHAADYIHHPNGYGCRVHESCLCCSSDLCPALVKRNMPMSHVSCHCLHHHHHHHQWSRCGDFLCPVQHSTLDDGTSVHADPWHLRKPVLQEVPLKEWTQQLKIPNRKCSQSGSDLCHSNSGFHRAGPFRPCCDNSEQDFPQCYRTVSSYDLSCEHSIRPELSSLHDAPGEQNLSRGRAYSVSQLNLDCFALRDKKETSLSKLEEQVPSTLVKKQKPPRPPPPNWDKYKERRASHQLTNSSRICHQENSVGSGHNISMESVRQRSQSLPMERILLNAKEIYHPSFEYEPPQNRDCSPVPSDLRPAQQEPDVPSETISTILEHERQETFSDCQKSLRDKSPPRTGHSVPSDPINSSHHETTDFYSPLEAGSIEEPVKSAAEEPKDGGTPPDSSHDNRSPDIAETEHPANLLDAYESGYRNYEDEWSTDRESEISIPDRYEFQPISPPPVCGAGSPTSCSAYYNTSAAKAELLNKMKELPGLQEEVGDQVEVEEEDELSMKKVQLIESISRKVSVLHEAQQGLQEDIHANTTLGCEVADLLKSLCKPNEYEKFRTFIGDLEKVVNLLLSLSGRLARVESALSSEDPEPSMDEKLNLLEKKKQLTEQLEDAKELKAHVTRREQMVLETVSRYLNEEQLHDYHHYVRMTSALIVEQRELEDKIRLGEEQLRCLQESL
ncbi:protein Shroom4 isoform X2 [Xenopus laevis]|uniref:Protein Shroom4 isoform X2 n=1 Tax=Xenopus laevis TaxID=8355 RepID=A0A8J1LHG4_XENLA|nr:protein Shroom4 isoform X2 [Xenopus laevis]